MKALLTTIFLLLFSVAIAFASPININTANSKQLQSLPGIGAKKAQTIIAYRTDHGPFKKIEDLVKVKGIGKRILEALKKDITVVDK